MAKNKRGNGQGSLFKRQADGPWIASWYDHGGERREKSTRTTDRAAAGRMLGKIVTDEELRRRGIIDPAAERIADHRKAKLTAHLADWQQAMSAGGSTHGHIVMSITYATRGLGGDEQTTLSDVTPDRVMASVKRLKDAGRSLRTCSATIKAAKAFTRWCVRCGRLSADPLAHLSGFNDVTDRRLERRPLIADELAMLLKVTEAAPAWHGISGADRAMLYRVATGTGFRASELASLTPGSFDLASNPPAVTVKAAYSKRRRDDRQPIRADLAELLGGYLAGKRSDAPALAVPDKAARMLKADLRRARARWIKDTPHPAERRQRRLAGFLAHVDGDGRIVDFHALRATYITMIVKGGASVKVAQELARHSDPRLTMNTYTKLGVHDLTGALDALPEVSGDEPQAERMRATGTYHARADAPGSARNWLRNSSEKQREQAQRGAMKSAPMRLTGDDRKELVLQNGSNAAQRGATWKENRAGGIRTLDLLTPSQAR